MFPLSDTKGSGKFAFWVLTFITINIIVFYLELTSTSPDLFVYRYALIPALIDFSNLSTLTPFITSQFLHGGFLHIISNMWFLWIFGRNVEERLGFLLFPIFYLFCGAGGAYLQFLFQEGSIIPNLGASGAIAGVLGAYLVFFSSHKIKTLIPIFGLPAIIDIPASFMLIYWFFTQLFSGTTSVLTAQADIGGIAFFAHIGGFGVGWLIAKMLS
jgi:membrane associated rhomboid family serine protease